MVGRSGKSGGAALRWAGEWFCLAANVSDKGRKYRVETCGEVRGGEYGAGRARVHKTS